MKNNKFWTIEKVKDGFENFFKINGRYPTAHDIDDFEHLPSSRQIQRRFGGLVELRKILKLEINHYGKGISRSVLTSSANLLGKKCEQIVLELLKEVFDEKFIHIEKPVEGNYKNRFDFYVYTKPENFAIDAFGSNDARDLINNFNIKKAKYLMSNNIKESLYFVYIGDNIDRKKLNVWYEKRRDKLPRNWKLLDLNELRAEIGRYVPYQAL